MSWSSIARSQGGTMLGCDGVLGSRPRATSGERSRNHRRRSMSSSPRTLTLLRRPASGSTGATSPRAAPRAAAGSPSPHGSIPFSTTSPPSGSALQRRWLTRADVSHRLEEYSGRPGVAILRRIAAQLGDGAAAESERTLHRLLRRAKVNGWVPNYRLPVAGRTYFVDVAFPAARLAVEIDGLAYHSDAERFQGDRHRQDDLVGAAWTVLARSA